MADILPPVIIAGVTFLLLLRNSHIRAVVKSIFRHPRRTSSLHKVNNGWIDTPDSMDMPAADIPQRHERPDHLSTPVSSGYDSRNGGTPGHG